MRIAVVMTLEQYQKLSELLDIREVEVHDGTCTEPCLFCDGLCPQD